MQSPSFGERSSRRFARSPWGRDQGAKQRRHQRPNQRRRARNLLCLPLAGLITLLLVGCVGRQPSSSSQWLKPRGSSALHNLNRGRIGAHPSSNGDYD